ncbi:unnamed protein product [Dibothriocephalus latus]|uniref:Uncharacterized protein n=1 Tax=Dibothriocephalus latus TaxID=60516 RepID=A0A3P6TU53_DIBLA|nr:unnamed protein product [Dibothriocephalus latus]
MTLACQDFGSSTEFDASNNSDDASSEKQRSQSVISLSLLNEKGENDLLEIDEADSDRVEATGSISPTPEFRVRSHSITERLNRRKHSHCAFENNRLSAAGREVELLQLLKEHSQLVHAVRLWSKIGKFFKYSVKMVSSSENVLFK